MTRMFVPVVAVLSSLSSVIALPAAVQAQTPPPLATVSADSSDVVPRPANITIDPMLQPVVDALLAKSPTLRRQWRTIGATPIVRVSIVSSSVLRESTNARARTEVSRYASGAMRAVVELPAVVDITELLPHELEHILEQIEGVNLPALAKTRAAGVTEVARGVYETDRARSAGLTALQEVYGEFDAAMSAAVRALRRAWQALTPDGAASPVEAARKGAPTPSDTGPNGVPAAPDVHKRP